MSFITFDIFNQFPELICVFSKRKGGSSKGIFADFNMSLKTGDLIETVESNRSNLFSKIGINEDRIAFADQVHSANVTVIDKPGIYRKTDAMICNSKGVFLSILTADCFPLFIYIPIRHTVAVIHAGWRGVNAGIVKNVFQILFDDFKVSPPDVYVVVGPGIQSECFEVGKDVYSLFPEEYLIKYGDNNKTHLNLQHYIVHQLKEYKIHENKIYIDSSCTKCMINEYFSHRRDGSKSGRMIGIIGIKKAFS